MKITVTPLLALINSAIGTYQHHRKNKQKINNKREGSENAETLERDLGYTHTGVYFSRDITLVAPRHNQNELTWRKLLPASHS